MARAVAGWLQPGAARTAVIADEARLREAGIATSAPPSASR